MKSFVAVINIYKSICYIIEFGPIIKDYNTWEDICLIVNFFMNISTFEYENLGNNPEKG